jgi:hypothetical protein
LSALGWISCALGAVAELPVGLMGFTHCGAKCIDILKDQHQLIDTAGVGFQRIPLGFGIGSTYLELDLNLM